MLIISIVLLDKAYYEFYPDTYEYMIFSLFFITSVLYYGYKCIKMLLDIIIHGYKEEYYPKRFDLSTKNNRRKLIKEITSNMKLVDNVSVTQIK